jgi:hypothetical protein
MLKDLSSSTFRKQAPKEHVGLNIFCGVPYPDGGGARRAEEKLII